ncbi:MAG TPA: hypothetical protein PKE40_02180 [Arachnia sp.]|nr:hypothetical protein [Arachnia sp.]HMT85138.1 hypothetical protein [Arachnia sp.]
MEPVKASNVLEWGDAFFEVDASSRTNDDPIAWQLRGTLLPEDHGIESILEFGDLQTVVCSCDQIGSWPATKVVSYACVTGPGAAFVDVALWPQATPPITGGETKYHGWNGSEFVEGPASVDGSGNYWYRLEIDWSPPLPPIPGGPTLFAKTYRHKGAEAAPPFRISFFRGTAKPQSVIENHRSYAFGTGAFTVTAVVGGTKALTGTIASQFSRHGEVPTGWELAIVDNPDGQPPDRYLSFALHGRTAAAGSQRFLASLSPDKAPQIADATSHVFSLPSSVFDRVTHDVAAVRDEAGACRMYLDGYLLDQVSVGSASGPVDVTNRHRIEAGAVGAMREPEQAFLVRKLGLWKGALTREEIRDQMNSGDDPVLGAACVGYWDFVHGGTKKDLDQSGTKNDVVPSSGDRAVAAQTVVPFYMQEQVQDNWCWSATSVSLGEFYDPPSSHRQCRLVSDMFSDDHLNSLTGYDIGHIVNRVSPGSSACGNGDSYDYWFYLELPLTFLGIFDRWTGEAHLDQLLESTRLRRPLLARVEWSGGNGHFIGVAGFYQEKVGAKEEQMVVIVDPFWGLTETTWESFMAHGGYLGDGTWTGYYYTRAATPAQPGGST